MKGIICMWSGLLADIPNGWALCDGTNGTPDLRNRFVMGVQPPAEPGFGGGAYTHLHTIDDPEHSHWIGDNGDIYDMYPIGMFQRFTDNAETGITVDAANHLPPYWRIAYIMKL